MTALTSFRQDHGVPTPDEDIPLKKRRIGTYDTTFVFPQPHVAANDGNIGIVLRRFTLSMDCEIASSIYLEFDMQLSNAHPIWVSCPHCVWFVHGSRGHTNQMTPQSTSSGCTTPSKSLLIR